MKVTIDDYIPCYYGGGPMFCRATGDELWVLLLEKAYAKLHGNYVQLRSGYVSHGMADLTGAPTCEFRFPQERHNYEAIESFADDLWEKLSFADARGYIMCAGTPGVDKFTEGGGPNEDSGIVPGHAYSVVAIKEHDGVRLMNVRNPWGQFEWGGAWSDNSSEWTEDFIQAIQPNFDHNDGSFWMSYQDFFRYFTSITMCKVDNWNEVRLKGIFLRAYEEEDEDEDFVLTKFHYTFHLEEEAEIHIGLHQEDERILGAELRRYVDLQVIILKRNKNGTLTVAHVSDNTTDRDLDFTVTLKPGHYIAVPRTCGATLSRPNVNPQPEFNLTYISSSGKEKIHPFVQSTMDDIFRRIDLQSNGQLSIEELHQFGELTDNDQFRNIDTDTLTSEEFKNISCNEDGITRFGMIQLMRNYSSDQIRDTFTKLGYDESLHSTKSKPFIISFQTKSDLRVRIGNSLSTDLNERARDLMMSYYLDTEGATGAIKTSEIVVFRHYFSNSYSVAFAAINKTNDEMEINFKMNKSKNMIFSPSKGTVRSIIPPQGLVYLSTAILDPGQNSFSYNYSFSAGRT